MKVTWQLWVHMLLFFSLHKTNIAMYFLTTHGKLYSILPFFTEHTVFLSLISICSIMVFSCLFMYMEAAHTSRRNWVLVLISLWSQNICVSLHLELVNMGYYNSFSQENENTCIKLDSLMEFCGHRLWICVPCVSSLVVCPNFSLN